MKDYCKITNITINGEEQPTVNARELWRALESKQEFSNWIKNRLTEFTEGVDFTVDKIINGENKGRFAAIEYTLTLDTAKHLAMLERNENGKKIRQYFIEFEKNARKAIEELVKDYEENIKFCQREKTSAPRAIGTASLKNSTVEMLDMLNRKIISGVEVDKEVLQYAWNVGRLFHKEIRKSSYPDGFEEFISGIANGKYRRADIYAAYKESCPNPMSARYFWPRARAIREIIDCRDASVRYVIF
jgi:phage anti-repressor protein